MRYRLGLFTFGLELASRGPRYILESYLRVGCFVLFLSGSCCVSLRLRKPSIVNLSPFGPVFDLEKFIEGFANEPTPTVATYIGSLIVERTDISRVSRRLENELREIKNYFKSNQG